jgi:hypothetical protein
MGSTRSSGVVSVSPAISPTTTLCAQSRVSSCRVAAM